MVKSIRTAHLIYMLYDDTKKLITNPTHTHAH